MTDRPSPRPAPLPEWAFDEFPGAAPTPVPPAESDENIRCWRCGRLLVEMATRPWRVKCRNCKAPNGSPPTGIPLPPPPERRITEPARRMVPVAEVGNRKGID